MTKIQKKPKAKDVVDFGNESSLIKIVKKSRNSSNPRTRKSDYKDIESKVKNYIMSSAKPGDKQIKGVYSSMHNEIISKITSGDVKLAIQGYVRYSFKTCEASDMLVLDLKLAEKFVHKPEEASPSDQGD